MDQFLTDSRGSLAQLPMPQVLPLPGTMAQPIDRHPVQRWARFLSGLERRRPDSGPGRER